MRKIKNSRKKWDGDMEESKIIQMIKEYFKNEVVTEEDIVDLLEYIKKENVENEEQLLKIFQKIDDIGKYHAIDDTEL